MSQPHKRLKILNSEDKEKQDQIQYKNDCLHQSTEEHVYIVFPHEEKQREKQEELKEFLEENDENYLSKNQKSRAITIKRSFVNKVVPKKEPNNSNSTNDDTAK